MKSEQSLQASWDINRPTNKRMVGILVYREKGEERSEKTMAENFPNERHKLQTHET